jgi:beta-glucuronidase
MTPKHAEALLSTAKELGCNFVRLAHYPHSELIARTADRMGIMLWEEIPLYWRPVFSDPGVKKQCRQSLDVLIQRDYSRPSVIIWSVANETPPEGAPARNKLLRELMAYTRKLDPTRLVSFATMSWCREDDNVFILNDPVCRYADLVGWNEYIGWYTGKPSEITACTLKMKYNRPLIISETGGGAKKGFYGKSSQRWTEEYQEAIYKGQVKLWKKTENCRGAAPWILMDFRSHMRQNEFQAGYNLKGIVDIRLRKKKAFKVLQDFYTRVIGP